jgi:hypothetical protein
VHLSYFHHTTGDRARDIIPLASSLGLGKHCMKSTGLFTIGNSSAVVPHVTTLLLNSFRCRQKNCTLAPSDLACLHEFFLDIFATFLTGIGILVVDCWYCRILCHCWLPMLLPSSLACCRIGAMRAPLSSSRQSKQDESLVSSSICNKYH